MIPARNEQRTTQLDALLSKVQREVARDDFVYGVTDRMKRSFFDRINDFLVDHSAVPVREKAYFFELLATMLHAGISLNHALKILTGKTEHPRLRRIIATLSNDIEHGRTLSQALDRFPDVFEESERGVVRSSEAVGTMERILFKVAGNLERRNDLGVRLKGAMIYPIAVLVALFIGISVMVVFVVPQLESVFAQSSLSLPLPTRILLGASVVISQGWWLMAIVALFIVAAFHIYTNSEEGRFSWDFRKLHIPLVGGIIRKIIVLRFIDTLGILIESGLPINQVLEYVAGAVGNEVYRIKTYEALSDVQEGKKLSASLAQAPFLFPETITNMVAVGEQTASLGELAQKIGSHYEREIDYTLKNLTTVLGPLLIVVIGGTVAFFALAVLSPIFSLTQAVQ